MAKSILLVLLAVLALATATTFQNCLTLTPNFKLRWSLGADHINVSMHALSSGWIAIGFSSDGSMPSNYEGSDVILGWVDDSAQARVFDYFATDYVPPSLDDQQDVTLLAGYQANSFTEIQFTRKLVTSDSVQDRAINPSTPTYIIWALNDKTDPAPSGVLNVGNKHTRKGSLQVTLGNSYSCDSQQGGWVSSSDSSEGPAGWQLTVQKLGLTNLHIAHGVLISFGLFIFILFAELAGRYLKSFIPRWPVFYMAFQSLGLIFIVVGFFIGVGAEASQNRSLSSFHGGWSVFVFICLIGHFVGSVFVYREALLNLGANYLETAAQKYVSWVGWLVYILVMVSCISGYSQIKATPAVWVLFVLSLLLPAGYAFGKSVTLLNDIMRHYNRMQDQENRGGGSDSASGGITSAEFKRKEISEFVTVLFMTAFLIMCIWIVQARDLKDPLVDESLATPSDSGSDLF